MPALDLPPLALASAGAGSAATRATGAGSAVAQSAGVGSATARAAGAGSTLAAAARLSDGTSPKLSSHALDVVLDVTRQGHGGGCGLRARGGLRPAGAEGSSAWERWGVREKWRDKGERVERGAGGEGERMEGGGCGT